jgi:hypothetical protein
LNTKLKQLEVALIRPEEVPSSIMIGEHTRAAPPTDPPTTKVVSAAKVAPVNTADTGTVMGAATTSENELPTIQA